MSSKEESFQLSVGAQNVEAKFYGKVAIVYVEGRDDVLFWSQYFDRNKFEIREKDGCRNLDDIIDAIQNNGLKQIVACDADYSFYEKKKRNHPLLVTTLSHSIECVMYCPVNLNNCIQKLARDLSDHIVDINSLYDTFCNDVKELVIYDIVNNVYKHGDSILGDSCVRFLGSNQSVTIDPDKVDDFLKLRSFPSEQLDEIRNQMKSDNRSMRQITKGHFQTGFVLNLLKKISSQIRGDSCGTISCDTLFAMLVDCSTKCNIECNEREYIKMKVKQAIDYLR